MPGTETKKIKRPLIAHFLDTREKPVMGPDGYKEATWSRIGLNVTDMSIDYGAQTETTQDIISVSATTDVTGYQPTAAVSQQCTKGDPIFDWITALRRKRAILGDCHTWLLNIDLWSGTESPEGTFTDAKGELQEVSIQVDNYGGAGGETPVQEFTINFVGNPIEATVTVANGVVSITSPAPAAASVQKTKA